MNGKFEYATDRRRILRAAVAVAGATLASAVVAQPPAKADAPKKLSKASVKYQDQPNGDKQCGNCEHFRSPSSCEIVEGAISPRGYCISWIKKA